MHSHLYDPPHSHTGFAGSLTSYWANPLVKWSIDARPVMWGWMMWP